MPPLARAGTTPPDRCSLPTPPDTTDRIRPTAKEATEQQRALVRLLQSYAKDVSEAPPWIEIPINREQYEALRETVIERLFRRHDFDPHTQRLALRMTSPVHEFFTDLVADQIKLCLRNICTRDTDQVIPPAAASFAARIKNGISSRILFSNGEDGKRGPDAQFQHIEAAYPGVVIEVAYTQPGKKLARIAEDYILHSNGDIKVVIGVDINSRGKEATLSMWRPMFSWSKEDDMRVLETRCCLSRKPFQATDGTVVNETSNLELELADFATDGLLAYLPQDEPVRMRISFKELFDLLQKAEGFREIRESSTSHGRRRTEIVRKRRRSPTPEEKLCSDDEARYQQLERSVDEADDDYRPARKRKPR